MKGIMFIEDMYNAVVSRLKTETRRTCEVPQDYSLCSISEKRLVYNPNFFLFHNAKNDSFIEKKPKYKVGEIVYLKEPYFICKEIVTYKFGNTTWDIYPKKYWKNKMFMPEKAARRFIKITNVRIEKLHEITKRGAINEGIERKKYTIEKECWGYKIYDTESTYDENPINSYWSLWDKINGKDSWYKNPYVFVYSFEPYKKLEDEFLNKYNTLKHK